MSRAMSRRGTAAAFLLLLLGGPVQAQQRGPDPGVWDGIRYFGTAAATDVWAVAKAPFEMNRGEAWAFAGVAAVGLALVPFDEPLWEHALEHREDAGYRHVLRVAKWVEPLALQGRMNKYYAAGTVAGYIVDSAWDAPWLRHVFEELLISNIISATGRKTIGRVIGRTRPSTGEGAYNFAFWDGLSFPSGHAANLATLATVLSHHIDWWPASVLLYGTVATVVYERVADSGHWASDSWIGAFVGVGIARIVIARREADTIEFGPLPSAGFGALPVGFIIRF